MKWLNKLKKAIVIRYYISRDKVNNRKLKKIQRQILIDEYKLIQHKKSKFTRSRREHVVKEVKKMLFSGEIKLNEISC